MQPPLGVWGGHIAHVLSVPRHTAGAPMQKQTSARANQWTMPGIGRRELLKYKIEATLSPAAVRDMAGNAFTSSVCAAAFLTLLLHCK